MLITGVKTDNPEDRFETVVPREKRLELPVVKVGLEMVGALIAKEDLPPETSKVLCHAGKLFKE